LRILEGERTGAHGYFQMSVQQAARGIREIHMKNDGGGGSLGGAAAGEQQEEGDAKDGAQSTFVHLLIIS
jgi:hypothetical protein